MKSHTPLQIKEANAARRTLARLQNKQVRLIKDDRLVKKPKNAFMIFSSERRSAGDFMHLRAVDTSTRISEEWKNMTEREKEVRVFLCALSIDEDALILSKAIRQIVRQRP